MMVLKCNLIKLTLYCVVFLANITLARDIPKIIEEAEAGDHAAQQLLISLYSAGDQVEQDWERSFYWTKRAAEEQGGAMNYFILGTAYYQGEGTKVDGKLAKKWYKKAIKLGQADAMQALGEMYVRGELIKKNLKKAIVLFEQATALGNIYAQTSLAEGLLNGEGIEQDEKRAVELLIPAAEAGWANAQHDLAVCLMNGQGIEKDIVQALFWYEKAALQGISISMWNLALLYGVDHYG